MDFYQKLRATNWRRVSYHLKHKYLTFDTIVIAVAAIVALSWTWGAVSVMQRNYTLQRQLEQKKRQLARDTLEVELRGYENAYYKSAEYQELAARQSLGLANPGEKVLILPENSEKATAIDQSYAARPEAPSAPAASNLSQWIDFLSGKNARRLN